MVYYFFSTREFYEPSILIGDCSLSTASLRVVPGAPSFKAFECSDEGRSKTLGVL